MTHIGHTSTSFGSTPTEWLKLGAEIGQQVNSWGWRSDLVAYVSPYAGEKENSIAFYNPANSEIAINTRRVFGDFDDPSMIGCFTERETHYDFPKATGAIFHEALHARFTRWSLAESARTLSAEENDALHLLEESRIEYLGAANMPENKVFLRASTLGLVMDDFEDSGGAKDTKKVIDLVGLLYARVDAGVLRNTDIDPVRPLVERHISPETLAKLQAIYREFFLLNHTQIEQMYDLAREWVLVSKEQAEENGESESGSDGEGESGEGGESGGSTMGEILEALSEAMEQVAFEASMEASDQQAEEAQAEELEQNKTKSNEKQRRLRIGGGVFSVKDPSETKSDSRLHSKRPPTSEERVAAVRLSKALEKANYRERERRQFASTTPPGRLRTRALVQGSAYRAMGVDAETEPWRRIQRKQVDDPELRIGVMVDISGSMSSAMEPMGSAAWIISEAVRRIHAKASMVYYGSGVFPTLKPGQHLDQVSIYTAPDGTEEFSTAFQALDGILSLTQGTGARLLIIVSDGQYRAGQRTKAMKHLEECSKAGVSVLWLGFGSYGRFAKEYCVHPGSVFVSAEESLTETIGKIEKATIEVLTKTAS